MFRALFPEHLPERQEHQDDVDSFLLDDPSAVLPVWSRILVPEQGQRAIQDFIYPLAGVVPGDKLAG